MRSLVVDASVAVKWLVDEPLADQAAKLLEDGLLLVAPELIYAEVANVLTAITRRGNIGNTDLRDALDLLSDAPFIVPTSMKQLMPAAARLAADLDHPVYDCMCLALAIQEQRPMVTADRRFCNVVREHPYLVEQLVLLESLA